MRVLVVDDEAPARRRLVRLLATLPDVEVVGEAADGVAALEALARTAVDLVLLDVQMPGMDGLELASRDAALPPIVFVTAHEGFAVGAFEVGAVDYLLKPVSVDRLAEAVRRVAGRIAAAPVVPRIVTQERGRLRVFDARTVTRFVARDKYTAFVVDGAEHLTEEPLAQLEARLGVHGFVRVHRAELVREDAIRTVADDAEGHVARLVDGQHARVSRRAIAALRKRLAR